MQILDQCRQTCGFHLHSSNKGLRFVIQLTSQIASSLPTPTFRRYSIGCDVIDLGQPITSSRRTSFHEVDETESYAVVVTCSRLDEAGLHVSPEVCPTFAHSTHLNYWYLRVINRRMHLYSSHFTGLTFLEKLGHSAALELLRPPLSVSNLYRQLTS